jgi:hypothetical protein
MTTKTTRRAMLGTVIAFPLAGNSAIAANEALAAAAQTPPDHLARILKACRKADRAAVMCDPIFPAIEAHRAALKEADARYDEHQPNYEKYVEGPRSARQEAGDDDVRERHARDEAMGEGIYHPTFRATADALDAATEKADEAARVLARTAPTTFKGLAAAIGHLADWLVEIGGGGDDVFIDDDHDFSQAFALTIAEAADRLAGPA